MKTPYRIHVFQGNTMKHTNIIISVRFAPSDATLLKEISKNRGQDVSDFVRLSVRKELARLSYLTTSEKKALEVKEGVK